MQAMALHHISSVDEGRQVIAQSLQFKTYESHQQSEWDEAYNYIKNLIVLNH